MPLFGADCALRPRFAGRDDGVRGPLPWSRILLPPVGRSGGITRLRGGLQAACCGREDVVQRVRQVVPIGLASLLITVELLLVFIHRVLHGLFCGCLPTFTISGLLNWLLDMPDDVGRAVSRRVFVVVPEASPTLMWLPSLSWCPGLAPLERCPRLSGSMVSCTLMPTSASYDSTRM